MKRFSSQLTSASSIVLALAFMAPLRCLAESVQYEIPSLNDHALPTLKKLPFTDEKVFSAWPKMVERGEKDLGARIKSSGPRPEATREALEKMEKSYLFWHTVLDRFYVNAGFQGAYCRLRERYLRARFKEAVTPEEILTRAKARDARVYVLGEDHTDYNAQDAYPELFKTLKKQTGEVRHLFIEYPSRFQKLVDDYFSQKLSYDDLAKAIWRDGWRPPKAELLELAKKEKLRVHCVDHEKDDQNIEARNERMAANVEKILSDDPGSKGILINGRSHLSPSRLVDGHVPKPIQLFLRERGLGTRAIAVLRPNRRADERRELSPADCDWSIRTEDVPALGFLPDGASRFLVAEPPVGWDTSHSREFRPSFWDDFDVVLYYPR